MNNNNNNDRNSESAMINAALELLTSSNPSRSVESHKDTTSEFKTIASEAPLDWRLEVSQTERFQVIQRLCQELFHSLPQDQKNDSRISQIAQQIEKRFFDSSKSKIDYFTNLKSQIFEIQRKSSNKNSNPSSSIGSPVPLAPAVTSADSAATLLNSDMSTSQTKIVPKVLSLSDQDKKVVKEKLGQIYHLFPKINGLVNTISSLGTKADVLQIQRLINIKKSIYYQLEGLKVDRYTISVEAANSLQATLVRYFQYGAMLIKQSQERSSQLQLLMDKNDGKTHGQLFQTPSPQAQPNTSSPGSGTFPINTAQSVVGNMTPNITTGVVSTPILPRSSQDSSSNAMKLSAQIKQQIFIQKINQKQVQARQNAKPSFTQQDIDFLLSENSPVTSDKLSPNKIDTLSNSVKEDDFSLYFNFEDDLSQPSPSGIKLNVSPVSRKRKSDSEIDTDLSQKRIRSNDQEIDKSSDSSPVNTPITVLQELENLGKEFDISFETIELDSLEDGVSQKPVFMNDNQKSNMGRVLVFCYINNSPLRIAFRLSSKAEYEQTIFDRRSRSSIINLAFFEKFRNYGFGLEDVEVVSEHALDYYEDIIKITTFATKLGVGISGNIVQISDILRYTFNDVLKNKN